MVEKQKRLEEQYHVSDFQTNLHITLTLLCVACCVAFLRTTSFYWNKAEFEKVQKIKAYVFCLI